MDDLLREFLTETSESLDTVDNQLVRFEQDPNNAKILDNIFRLVHTIKGTCGFLGLPRLEALAHAAETLMGKFRDGMPVTGEAVTLILSTIDRIKEILGGLEATEAEPEGTDEDLIDELEAMVEGGKHAEAAACCRRRRAAPVAAPPCSPRQAARARWSTRCWSARCVRAKSRSTSSSAPSARPQTEVAPAAAPACRQRRSRARAEAAPAAKRDKAKPARPRPTRATSRKPTRSPTSRSASTSIRSSI